MIKKNFHCVRFLVGFAACCWFSAEIPTAYAEQLSFGFAAPAAITITADKSNISLQFADFVSGTLSNVVTVTYNISANNVSKNTSVLTARLQDTFPNINFQVQFDHYVKTKGNASLVASQPNYITLGTSDISIVDKHKDKGNGKTVIGNLYLRYRAGLTCDVDASQTNLSRPLYITFTDT